MSGDGAAAAAAAAATAHAQQAGSARQASEAAAAAAAQQAEAMLQLQAAMAVMMKERQEQRAHNAQQQAQHAQLLALLTERARLDGSTAEGLDQQRVRDDAARDAGMLRAGGLGLQAEESGSDGGDDERKQQIDRATARIGAELRADAAAITREAGAARPTRALEVPAARQSLLVDTGADGGRSRPPEPAAVAGQQPHTPTTHSSAAAAPAVWGRTLQLHERSLEPSELRNSEAGKADVLEDWIYGVERWIKVNGLSTYDDRREVAGRFMDRAAATWLRAHEAMRGGQGAPIGTWAAFVQALRAHYTPVSDEGAAFKEMVSLRMRSEESMSQYVSRATAVFTRLTAARMPPAVAGEHLQNGVDRQRFPISFRDVEFAQQQGRERAGRGMDFHELGAALQQAAAREPPQRSVATGSGYGGAASRGGAAAARPTTRVSALAQRMLDQVRDEQTDDNGAGEDELRAAAIEAAGAYRCPKCGEVGHSSRDCTSKKELRTCFLCQQTGHIKPHCPKRTGRAEGAASGSGGRPQKNE